MVGLICYHINWCFLLHKYLEMQKMVNLSRPSLLFVLLLTFVSIFWHSRPILAQEVEDQKEFDYITGSDKGPERWGELHKEWADCKNGDLQSPIDLLNKRVEVVAKLGKLKRSYKPCNATLKNRGHDIMLQWDGDAGSVEINGTEFELRQLHWHSPSEHTINGNRFDLEAHLVHVSADNKTAVIGVMYDIGRSDSLLSKLEEKVWSLTDNKTQEKVGVIDPRHVKIVGTKYYRYLGSLTTPPCTEGVIWTINRKIMTVSREQVTALREAVHDHAEKNARPLQPINHREIHLFSPRQRRRGQSNN